MKMAIVKIICFCALLLCVLGYVNKVFSVKHSDGIYSMTKFYEQEENTTDVVVLGSSHAFEDINTGVLWDEYGIASYVLAGSVQPMWNTYYYLKEALKTQKPELVILEAYTVRYTMDYADDSCIIKNTYGMKWSKDKIEAIQASVPRERWAEFILTYIQYHTRYTELSAEDFLVNKGNALYDNWKGFGNNMETTMFEMPDVSHVVKRERMPEKSEKYYRMTIELAQDNDIPILVVLSPFAGINPEQQAVYNTAADIAQEYGVHFVNYNLLYEDIGIDFSCDAADGGHLNYSGNMKYTKALGKYIKENYNITDRRGDGKYESWEDNSEYIAADLANKALAGTMELQEINEKIKNPNYILIVSVDGYCSTKDENLKQLFEAIGLHRTGENGVWCIDNSEGVLFTIGWEEMTRYRRMGLYDFRVSRVFDEDAQTYVSSVIINNNEYIKVKNGVNIQIYDTVTRTIVDSFGIDMDNSYRIVR